MGGNCEIVEEMDVPSTTQQTHRQLRSQEKDKKPPLKKGLNKFLENDINKLFESVNLRTSKSLDLTDSYRNASKKSMRASSGFNSPVGFSEPVSLKQALRGLCISQAAEMAASKRLASPRISNLMNSATPSSCPSPVSNIRPIVKSVDCISSEIPANKPSLNLKEPKIIPVCAEDYQFVASVCSQVKKLDIVSAPPHHNVPKPERKVSCSKKLASVQSETTVTSPKLKIIPVCEEDYQLVKNVCSQEKKLDIVSAPPHHTVSKPESKVSSSKKVASVQSEIPATSSKGRRKSRLQNVSSSSEIKSNGETKAVRSNPRAVKPVVIKKTIKLALTTGVNSKTLNGVHNVSEHSSGKLVCQRCQCSMKESVSAPTVNKNKDISVTENHITDTLGEKVIFSQSSKSSGCGFSSSTTSLSEESSLSGSSSSTRPHMSKDMRWGVITRVKEHSTFLGLSQFNLLKKLGAGDIGTVYLAELIGTNCPFAIKVMDNDFLGKRKKMARAQTEREILRMLDHPFLPTLYAQFMSDNLSCLVMEFCPGGDLHVLRQKQPCRYFPEQAARFYAAEVLLALEYLHMLGIIYRDLKPENILVREDGHIMLTDFDLSLRCSVSPTLVKSSAPGIEPPRVSGPCAGSNCVDPFCASPSCKMSCFSPRIFPASSRARKLKAEAAAHARSLPQLVAEPTTARSNSFVGTHEYLAPEIIKGEGHGSAVDWWTFGVFLYELLYGKTPFRGVGNDETLSNVVFQSLKFPDTPIVSSQGRDLIRGLLVKDPDNRFGTETGAAEIKRHPFFEGLNWALIRCTVPPQIPEFYEVGSFQVESEEKGGHIEFELF